MAPEELPTGSALLVVQRGRNAGARFLLNRPVTTAGRLPGATSCSTTSPSADDTPSFESKTDNTAVDTGSLNKTYLNRRPVE
jgi:pSer/pThr/pTyr-binding forkhead associated (FHA) protein